jgi:hypothetical protein
VKGGAVDWEKGLMAKMQMMLSRVCATAWSLAIIKHEESSRQNVLARDQAVAQTRDNIICIFAIKPSFGILSRPFFFFFLS